MRQVSPHALVGLAADIRAELDHLRRLAQDIAAVQAEIERDPDHARLFYENLALKLHNFYTGCERIFQTVASELNGAPPTGFDWHRRLLERMAVAWQGRPALLSASTADDLREYRRFAVWCAISTASSWILNASNAWLPAIPRHGARCRSILSVLSPGFKRWPIS